MKTWEMLNKTRDRSGFWSLADQGVVSLGNFLTNIVLARNLSPKEYGTYAVLLGVLLVMYTVHGAFVSYPLTLQGAAESPSVLRALTAFSLWLTGGIGLVLGAGLMIGCWVAGRESIGPWAAAAIVCWLWQETARRGLMTHMKFRESVWGDGISYLGQAAAVFVLSRVGRLSIESAFAAIAATSLLATVLQVTQLDMRSLRLQRARAQLYSFWKLSRWMVFSSFTGIFSGQFLPWALALLRGAPLAGAFQALSNVAGVANPIFNSVANLIVPASAKAAIEHGPKAAFRKAVDYGVQGSLLIVPFLVLVLVWPHRVLSILYGAGSQYASLGSPLRLFVAAQGIYYVAVIAATLLNSLGHTRVTFTVLVTSAFVTIAFGVPLILYEGLLGAVATVMIGTLVRAVMVWVEALRKSLRVVPGDLRYEETA